MGAALYNVELRSGTHRAQVISSFPVILFHVLDLFWFWFSHQFLRLSEILEEEAEVYMRKDPDPFDERHPSRTDPESNLGKNLKLIFKKEQFMNR